MNIKELAEQANEYADWSLNTDPKVNWYEVRDERFAELIRQDEREACAALCEELHNCETDYRPDDCAGAIRARGEQ